MFWNWFMRLLFRWGWHFADDDQRVAVVVQQPERGDMQVSQGSLDSVDNFSSDGDALIVCLTLEGEGVKFVAISGISRWPGADKNVFLVPMDAEFAVLGSNPRGFGERVPAGFAFKNVQRLGRPVLVRRSLNVREASELQE